MTWLQRYRVRSYVANSIFVFPVLGILVALGMVRLIHWFDHQMNMESTADPQAARELLGSLASSVFTLIIFVSSALLLAVQLASAQLTPRIIALVFRSAVTKFSLTAFAFTFTFSLAALVRIKTVVPPLTAHVAAYSCLLSLCLFFYLIDQLGKFLRPSGTLRTVSRLGHRVIESVYPHSLIATNDTSARSREVLKGEPTCTVLSRSGGVILALDIKGLVSLAERFDCVMKMVPQVGDFISAGEPLFQIFGAGPTPGELRHCVAVGAERTFEQDPAFAFRVIVDIASKGLSPAINDPTTAVLAIDQIHHLLRRVGDRFLDEGRVQGADGRLRLVYRTPDWEDFVQLAVTEIRQFGSESIQIARRLRAMLESLIQTLPEERAKLLRRELELLHRSTERSFPEPEDRALAVVGDPQGVGTNRPESQTTSALDPLRRK
jgi:uncharacterized membrane protein